MTRFAARCAALLAALLIIGFVSLPASAQQGQRVRGRITAVHGDVLTVKASDGRILTIALDPDATVTRIDPAKLSAIKPGRFVGTAARPEPNNRWRAIEVHIFPAGARLGEGHRPWDPEPGATMTNADVTAAVVHTRNGAMTLTTGGQSYDIDVPPGTPIVTMSPGTRKQIVKRAYVSVNNAIPKQDGTLVAKSINVSRDNKWPPK